jgi:hypothetical protein
VLLPPGWSGYRKCPPAHWKLPPLPGPAHVHAAVTTALANWQIALIVAAGGLLVAFVTGPRWSRFTARHGGRLSRRVRRGRRALPGQGRVFFDDAAVHIPAEGQPERGLRAGTQSGHAQVAERMWADARRSLRG